MQNLISEENFGQGKKAKVKYEPEEPSRFHIA
jgi:hypothetical protein